MTRLALAFPAATLLIAACGGGPAPASPAPDTVFVPDTVLVERPAALPEGRTASLCLATGQSVNIRISAAGDTLVGTRRVRLAELGPGIGFVGDYAADEGWFINDAPITFDRRQFSKFGPPESRDCGGMKIVGDYDGVNLFAELAAAAPFAVVYVPVRPGVFQPYQAGVGRVRG